MSVEDAVRKLGPNRSPRVIDSPAPSHTIVPTKNDDQGLEETMRFKDKVALISAAANGIGRATATIMAREGATVIAVDNHQGRLDEAVPALRQAARRAARRKAGWSTRWTPARSTGWSPRSSAITAASTSWSTRSAAAR